MEAFDVKGSVLQGYVKHLRAKGYFDAVREKAPPELKALLDQPVLVSSWMPARRLQEIHTILEALYGVESIATLGEAAARDVAPILMPLISGFLKVFGATPASLYSRMEALLSRTHRGIRLTWVPKGERAGTLSIDYAEANHPRDFTAWRGTFAFVFELTKTKGTITFNNPEGKRVDFRVAW